MPLINIHTPEEYKVITAIYRKENSIGIYLRFFKRCNRYDCRNKLAGLQLVVLNNRYICAKGVLRCIPQSVNSVAGASLVS